MTDIWKPEANPSSVLRPTSRSRTPFEKLSCVLAHLRGYGNPSQHAGKFFRAFRFRKHSDCRGGLVPTSLLFYQVMPFAVACYLRKVRNADDLVALRELFQLNPYKLRGAAADSRVNLVEDKCFSFFFSACKSFEGEQKPGEFAD